MHLLGSNPVSRSTTLLYNFRYLKAVILPIGPSLPPYPPRIFSKFNPPHPFWSVFQQLIPKNINRLLSLVFQSFPLAIPFWHRNLLRKPWLHPEFQSKELCSWWIDVNSVKLGIDCLVFPLWWGRIYVHDRIFWSRLSISHSAQPGVAFQIQFLPRIVWEFSNWTQYARFR